jgi:CheY-specific phosphatase CheX
MHMAKVNMLDLREFIIKSMSEVFDMMLSMNLSVVDESCITHLNGEKLVGSVSFAGKASGNINIHVGCSFAKTITAKMLGMKIDEIESEEEIHDVIGETINMVGGNLKSRLCDSGFHCELSIPSITSGGGFYIESKDWQYHEKIFMENNKQIVIVEVFMKSGS